MHGQGLVSFFERSLLELLSPVGMWKFWFHLWIINKDWSLFRRRLLMAWVTECLITTGHCSNRVSYWHSVLFSFQGTIVTYFTEMTSAIQRHKNISETWMRDLLTRANKQATRTDSCNHITMYQKQHCGNEFYTMLNLVSFCCFCKFKQMPLSSHNPHFSPLIIVCSLYKHVFPHFIFPTLLGLSVM